MIVSPRRLILAFTFAPPVIKIKQQGGSVQLLTFMSHYTLYADKQFRPFFLSAYSVYADKKLSAYTLYADKKSSAYTLYADKANLNKIL